jgi:hypothetical protein
MAMRTRFSLANNHREELLALVASRGEKSVSKVVEEALVFYLGERNKPAVVPTPIAPPEMPGRWQRMGALVDRTWREGALMLGMTLRQLRARSTGRAQA